MARTSIGAGHFELASDGGCDESLSALGEEFELALYRRSGLGEVSCFVIHSVKDRLRFSWGRRHRDSVGTQLLGCQVGDSRKIAARQECPSRLPSSEKLGQPADGPGVTWPYSMKRLLELHLCHSTVPHSGSCVARSPLAYQQVAWPQHVSRAFSLWEVHRRDIIEVQIEPPNVIFLR